MKFIIGKKYENLELYLINYRVARPVDDIRTIIGFLVVSTTLIEANKAVTAYITALKRDDIRCRDIEFTYENSMSKLEDNLFRADDYDGEFPHGGEIFTGKSLVEHYRSGNILVASEDTKGVIGISKHKYDWVIFFK